MNNAAMLAPRTNPESHCHTGRVDLRADALPRGSVDDMKPILSHRLGTTGIKASRMSRRCCQSGPERSNRRLDAGGESSRAGPQAAAEQTCAAARARGIACLLTEGSARCSTRAAHTVAGGGRPVNCFRGGARDTTGVEVSLDARGTVMRGRAYRRVRLHPAAPSPARPKPRRRRVAGSGTLTPITISWKSQSPPPVHPVSPPPSLKPSKPD